MGHGWSEWPLIIFTVFGQCVAGGFIVMAAAVLTQEGQALRQRILVTMLGLWVAMGLGFVASTLHLGSPLRAFNALNQIGSSALSNEIASGALFFALGGLWWLLSLLNRLPAALDKGWMVLNAILGVVMVWMMARVYNSIETIPTWNSVWTPVHFFLTMLIGGPLFGLLLLRLAGFTCRPRGLAYVVVAAVVVSIAAVMMQTADLAGITTSVNQALALIPNYGAMMAARVVLLAAALAVWLVPHCKGNVASVPALGLALLLAVLAEMLGRCVFYGLHMTSGVL